MKNRIEKMDMDRQNEKDEAVYYAMYYSLFHDVTNAVEILKKTEDMHAKEAGRILESGQYKTEEIYMQIEGTCK